MEKIIVTEEMHPEKEWFEQAPKQTLNTLTGFVDHVMNDYEHDYGTVCHAMAACALAAAYAADKTENGGITSFQAGFVMWGFVRQWLFSENKTGMKITDYDNMLHPHYADKFEKTISKGTWRALQKEANRLLETSKSANPAVVEHWKSIVNGVVPFGYKVGDE